MGFLSNEERATLLGAEENSARTPLPLQMVSSDEYLPNPMSAKQREVSQRLDSISQEVIPLLGVSRRRFFQTAGGMAASFVALNQTYGPVFAATLDEARSPEIADARAGSFKDQFVIDVHTHFVKDDYRAGAEIGTPFPWRATTARLGWNPQLKTNVTIETAKYANYHKEIFFDSDTKVALISSVPGVEPKYTILTNQQMADARQKVNAEAGSRRMLSHAMFAPGVPGWEEDMDAAIELKPDSWKGYTIGASGRDANGGYKRFNPWRMDSEIAYKAYAKMLKAGITTVCVHKGLFPPSMTRAFPELRGFVDVSDVGQAAKDWPQLNFVIYHAGYQHSNEPTDVMKDPLLAVQEFDRTGRISWVSDLAEIPELYGVNNVYCDLGQTFAMTLITQPRICAALLGILVRGLGADHVCWGTDAVWTGSPQWQIEGLRRIEIPEDMRKRHGFKPLGDPTGPVKSAILADNSARLYGIDHQARSAVMQDKLAAAKREYDLAGREPSNLQYGFVARS